MTLTELYGQLAEIKESAIITVPVQKLWVGEFDGIAGELLLWIINRIPNATQGDVEEVLAAATWWSTYTASIAAAEQVQKDTL